MLIEHRGIQPSLHPDAYVATTAVIIGDVAIASGARIMHGAVLNAEDGQVRIGRNTVIMENTVVRGRSRHGVFVGNSVMVGPHAHLNGTVVEDEAFIATGASLFPGSRVGAGAEVRINPVVQVNTRLAPGAMIPIGWVAVGDTARILSPERHDEIWAIQRELDFPGTVYGVDRTVPMGELMGLQSKYYGTHRGDTVIEPSTRSGDA
ncbi:gamma carbonic anhydrase family protein [Arthrobacter sp. ISL-72]|uniref:gamma carbonic anhydrase family protein n=1 Tax=Arthrobacter sp. ISL-72 TaxID=2819114 RepID=UPI001BECE7F3|nr:gamma carbonic anhydrase family protein [Arthrobacter sp. ISL-72]MBT2596540.1 gamma carbonic anhydrase family protein [Arthrobacter sp. ISL-72]